MILNRAGLPIFRSLGRSLLTMSPEEIAKRSLRVDLKAAQKRQKKKRRHGGKALDKDRKGQ